MTTENENTDKGEDGNDFISTLRYENVRRTGLQTSWNRVVFAKPKEIGCFSLDSERKLSCDAAQLKILVKTHGDLDLNDGYKDRFVKRDENIREGLNHILNWIQQKKMTNNEFRLPKFVMWRGHMTRIMCTPYESRDGWKMAVQKRGNTIYISEIELEEAVKKRQERTDKEKLMMYWGVRYEGYASKSMTESDDEPNAKTRKTETITNTNEAYCAVLTGSINHHTVLFAGEVDCCDGSLKSPTDNYIELKTSRIITTKKQNDNFHRYKTVKWWAQSYLAGVPLVICGFRNDEGVVKNVAKFNTLHFPRLARNVPYTWNPNVCLDFLEYFLTSVVNICNEEDIVWTFTYKPNSNNISYKKEKLLDDIYVLPNWYNVKK